MRYGIPSMVPFKFLAFGMVATAIISIGSTLELINQTNLGHTHPSNEQNSVEGDRK
ncbi:MAG: hypothetical protein N4J56_007028 [Chroococcidiopsis sp. SAG 2025]|uniref:hypothetical protein n=1 Tax=Chroococcidiopsis sp. SAG 2025 TaxID=171389 RepID=UPI0029374886|nr:hypothetical protein [Chroococcidiopsis sp. SAG 2025]MDV2997323.1 hypothetical protein [Chroococcidiopsis sp. SAG 2025]